MISVMDSNLAFTMHAGNKEFGQGNEKAKIKKNILISPLMPNYL